MAGMIASLSLLGRETLRIVLPALCVVCAGELPWKDRKASCCGGCWASLPRIRGGACRRCGTPNPRGDGWWTCLGCQAAEGDALEEIWAWGPYGAGLERLIQSFKFEGHHFLARPLGKRLAEGWLEEHVAEDEVVVPVPMHPAKLARRGFNQSALLARSFARRIGLRMEPLLAKTRDTEPQSRLPRDGREKNLRGAFRAAGPIRGRSVLLVDDVCTTGTTLRAAAAAAVKGGAARVRAAVVARA